MTRLPASFVLRYFFLPLCIFILSSQPAFSGLNTTKRLFILQKNHAGLVEYDLKNFGAVKIVKLPKEALDQDCKIIVNHPGQILVYNFPNGERQRPAKYWLWDGKESRVVEAKELSTCKDCNEGGYGLPRFLLAADGRDLFRYETPMDTIRNEDKNGYEVPVVKTTFQLNQTDLDEKNGKEILKSELPDCTCNTGACTETCPVGYVFSPLGVIEDFFFVTYWVPGQIGSTYLSTYIFQKKEKKWIRGKLDQLCEDILDAADHGDIIVETLPDGGCCGWDNSSSDTTFVRKNGRRVTIYDEYKKYGNADYDVSFFSADAQISPDLSMVAHTIASTMKPEERAEEIHLSANVSLDRKIPPEEALRLKKIIEQHPVVEIISLGDSPRKPIEIQKASLIGWLNAREILIFKEKKLIVVDAQKGKQVAILPVDVEKAEHVFLR